MPASIEFIEPPEEGMAPYVKLHGSVQATDCWLPSRYTLGIPMGEELRDNRLHGIVSGFGGFKRSSRAWRDAMVTQEGIATFSFEPARYGGLRNDLLRPQKAHYDTLSLVIEDIAQHPGLEEVLDKDALEIDETVLLQHSMGGLAGPVYAIKNPGSVSQLTLVEAAGTEEAKWSRFFPRLPLFGALEVTPAVLENKFCDPEDTWKMLVGVAKYYYSNPVRSVGEMLSCIRADRRPMLASLGEAGIYLAMIYGERDSLIPAKEAMAATKDLPVGYRSIIDIDHLGPQTEAAVVAEEVACASDSYYEPLGEDQTELPLAA